MAAARLRSSINIKKTVKNSVFGHKNLRQIFMVKDQCVEWGEKVWLVVVPATDCISSIFCPVIPSKQQKNAKIGKNRLFLGDFGFKNIQICQIMY